MIKIAITNAKFDPCIDVETILVDPLRQSLGQIFEPLLDNITSLMNSMSCLELLQETVNTKTYLSLLHTSTRKHRGGCPSCQFQSCRTGRARQNTTGQCLKATKCHRQPVYLLRGLHSAPSSQQHQCGCGLEQCKPSPIVKQYYLLMATKYL